MSAAGPRDNLAWRLYGQSALGSRPLLECTSRALFSLDSGNRPEMLQSLVVEPSPRPYPCVCT